MEKKIRNTIFSFKPGEALTASCRTRILSLFFVMISCMVGNILNAQDIIILKNGDAIKSKVSEVGTDLIKYKKFENLTGPVYSIEKTKVYMIQYENGAKDVFTVQPVAKDQTAPKVSQPPVNSSSVKPLQRRGANVRLEGKWLTAGEVRTLMTPYPYALHSYNTGKTFLLVTDICLYTGIGVAIIATLSANKYKSGSVQRTTIYTEAVIVDGTLIVGALIMNIIGNGKVRSSVNLYNSSINKSVTYKLNFGIQEHGVGLALKF